MKFNQLCEYIEKIETTSSRTDITRLLAELFQKLSADEIDKTVYLLQGRVAPLFEKIEFGMAEKMIIRAVISAFQLDKKVFDREYQKHGDVGKTAEIFRKDIISIEEKELTISQTFDLLYKMATTSGTGSQELKSNILSQLMKQLSPLSSRYLARISQGVMRLGFSDMTVLDAFSWMLTGDKTLRPNIEKAYHVRPDLGFIGRTLKEKGIKIVEKIEPHIFTPILMMRAERLSSPEEIVEKIGECVIEPKYDGFRVQIHYSKKKNEVRLYSRGLEEISEMYPDIIEGVKNVVHVDDIIMEGEAIGFDPHSGNFLPFQETVQRKRKYGIEEKAKEIPLKLFAFEMIYLNGETYINKPFLERRRALEKVVKRTGDIFKDPIIIAPEIISGDAKKLELFFDDSITKGLEGIVAKKKEGVYQPGARGWNWIKFKRSYSSKIEDTIDCLVMGYDFGKGKRSDFGIGAFLVGVYDEKEDMFLTIAKIGSGLTDDEWREMKINSEKYKSEKKPALYTIDKMMECDVWVKPKIVVEIKADEITRSPVHTAGRVMKSSKSGQAFDVDVPGYALRFPRLQRFRDDKKPEDTTNLRELEQMFKDQGKK